MSAKKKMAAKKATAAAKQPPRLRPVLEALRALVEEVAPEATALRQAAANARKA